MEPASEIDERDQSADELNSTDDQHEYVARFNRNLSESKQNLHEASEHEQRSRRDDYGSSSRTDRRERRHVASIWFSV